MVERQFEIKVVDRNNWNAYGAGLQELESTAEYPYGADAFRIDHGSSYFRFFERLGEPYFHLALDRDRIVACAAGVLRRVPIGRSWSHVWYLCDLKVHPDYRGLRLPLRLFRKRLLRNYLRCPRGYAISMNPESGPNRMVGLIRNLSWLRFEVLGQLHFYSLTREQVEASRAQLLERIGPFSFLCLKGQKDLVLRSTGRPLNLLHFQHGPLAKVDVREPQTDAVHMLCAPAGSVLDLYASTVADVSARASVIGHRMKGFDVSVILSSDV